jgi:hypothetical protein
MESASMHEFAILPRDARSIVLLLPGLFEDSADPADTAMKTATP